MVELVEGIVSIQVTVSSFRSFLDKRSGRSEEEGVKRKEAEERGRVEFK